jgi:hypothetical protein
MKKNYCLFLSTLLLCTLVMSCKKNRIKPNLSHTNWVITRFDNTLTNLSEFPIDTIHFLDDENYQINNLTPRNYNLRKDDNRLRLSLDDCSTFGGSYSTKLTELAIEDGQLNNQYFYTLGDNEIIVWMTRIQ